MNESHVLLLFFTGVLFGSGFAWALTMDYVQRKYRLRLKRPMATRGKV